eukprot:scaffold45012_cov14-Prasinocladus_malaysianus.AAC.1
MQTFNSAFRKQAFSSDYGFGFQNSKFQLPTFAEVVFARSIHSDMRLTHSTEISECWLVVQGFTWHHKMPRCV